MIESDLFYEQSPHGIHDGHDKDACIGKNAHPHIGQAQRPQDKDNHLDPDGKINILVDNGHAFLEMRMAFPIFKGSSSIKTTSAASMAASDPIAPMAIPTSARERTGASLMPSPTKRTFSLPFFCWVIFSRSVTLSSGKSSL